MKSLRRSKPPRPERDYTGKLGQLFADDCPWPMYSFGRAALLFWNGFANGLRRRGLTDRQIKTQLQSVGARWLLDDHAATLERLGAELV